MKKERLSNFELMRIVSMIFIVLWHVIGSGHVAENSGTIEMASIFRFLRYIFIIHVNSFVLILGYFQCKNKFKLSKVLSLVFQVLFYSITIFFVLFKIGMIKEVNLTVLFNVLLPFSSVDYWFVSAYLVAYVLSDYINVLIKNLNHNQLLKLIFVYFIIFSVIPFCTGLKLVENNGSNFYNFVFLYIIGAYLRLYPFKKNYIFDKISTNAYRIFLIALFFLCSSYNFLLFEFVRNPQIDGQILKTISNILLCSRISYASPIVIIQSVCYFEFFRTLKIKSRVINFISGCTFGIYLFHEHIYLRDITYQVFKFNNDIIYGRRIYFKVLFVALILFITGLIVEVFRKLLSKLIVKTPIYKKVRIKFYNFIESFSVKREES